MHYSADREELVAAIAVNLFQEAEYGAEAELENDDLTQEEFDDIDWTPVEVDADNLAERYAASIEKINGRSLSSIYEEMANTPGHQKDPTTDQWAYGIVMPSLGHGVGWGDYMASPPTTIEFPDLGWNWSGQAEVDERFKHEPNAQRQRAPGGHDANPQDTFNPIDYRFRWTDDWYEWDSDAAHKDARRARDEQARELRRELGFKPKKFTLRSQLVKRGGIGSGHPEIEHFVTVYGLQYEQPRSYSDNARGPGGRFESRGRGRLRATLPAGWHTTREGEASWTPAPGHEYRISKERGRWAITHFPPGARSGEWVRVEDLDPSFESKLGPEARGPGGAAMFVHSFDAADAAALHWQKGHSPNPRRRAPGRGVIGAGGLLAPRSISLQEDTMYYMGASSSPDSIVVTRLGPDRVYYLAWPYQGEPRPIERWIGEDLIAKGTETWASTPHNAERWPEEVENLRKLLAGEQGEQVDVKKLVRDHEKVRINVVARREGQDLWRQAEQYGSVSGMALQGGGEMYKIEGYRGQLEEILDDPEFEVVDNICRIER